MMPVYSLPQMLLIAGTGRNSGKTTLACRVISHHSYKYPIAAIKVSRHLTHAAGLITVNTGGHSFYIGEDTGSLPHKDSARMLKAGAIKSYFVVAADEALYSVVQFILSHNEDGLLYVVESGGLRHVVEPGLFVLVSNPEQQSDRKAEWNQHACTLFSFTNGRFDPDPDRIEIYQNQWKLKETE